MDDIEYTITPLPASRGGGWVLNYFVDRQHTGGGYFPAPRTYDHVVASWWETLTDERQQEWLRRGGANDRAGAYHAVVLAKLFDQAEQTGKAWIARRGKLRNKDLKCEIS